MAAGLLPAVVVGLLVLLWAATSGPARLVSPAGRIERSYSPEPSPTGEPDDSGPGSLEEATEGVEQTLDLSWIGDLIAWAIALAVCLGVLHLLRLAWERRWRRPQRPERLDFDVLPADRVADTLRDDARTHLDAVADGEARNAIVACWRSLETSVARAGLARYSSETSSEYVVRVLRRLDLDPRAVAELAGLYREARFSDHELGEDERDRARTALETLHRDLQSLGTTP